MKRAFLSTVLAAVAISHVMAGTEQTVSMATSLTAEQREDLGDLRPAEEQSFFSKHFRFNVQTRGEFVTNSALKGNHGNSDFLVLPNMEAGFNLPLGGGFTFDILGRFETFAYTRDEDRSFWGVSGAATLEYQFKPGWPRIYAGVEPYSYRRFENSDTVAEAVGLTVGAGRELVFNHGRTMVFGGYNFSSYFASPSLDDRNTHRLVLGINQQLRPSLIGQVYYSWQFTEFDRYDRNDSRHVAGANLIYQFSERLFGTLSAAFADNDSSFDTASYQNLTISAGVALQF
jgi:hypothetical protein